MNQRILPGMNTIYKFFIITIILLIAACGSLNVFPVSDDIKLGKQVCEDIEKNPNQYPILDRKEATSYLQGIVNTIINSPSVQYRGVFAYTVKIILNDNVINAFCTPGGYIYVYTGLLRVLDNEATLAGVLAHEIAHAELRHSTQRLTKAYGAQMMLDLALTNNTDKNVDFAANLFTGMALLKNSRDDETDSDIYSFKYLQSTGKWYPGAIKMFFEKMSGKGMDNALRELLSTHPVDRERMENINRLLRENNIPPPQESNLGYRRYQEFKNKLF